MILLDRYLLRNFLTPFALCFFGFLSIWLIFDLQSNISDFLDANVSVRWIAYYYLTQAPQFMLICIPVGLLLALLFCLSKMSRANEIIAMLTAGQSLPRLLLPLIACGVVLSGVCVALNFSLAPHSDSIKKELRSGISRRNDSTSLITGQVFRNRADRRTWYVTTMPVKAGAKDDPLLQGVYVIEQNETGQIDSKWYAYTARYKPKTQTWLLFNGKVVQFAKDGSVQSEKAFQTLQINNWSETPWRIVSANLDPQSLSVPELREYLRHNADFPTPQLAPFRTHLQYRWSVPMQCLIVILFTGPLAIVYSRRGVLSGIATAIFLFAGMTFFGFLMLAFGKGNRIPPFAAAWTPIILFGLLGLYLIYLKGTNREPPKLTALFRRKAKR